MTVQDYNSMISLYTEIEANFSAKQLSQIETPDSDLAKKIAQDFFLVSLESSKDGITTRSLHFQKKHFYDFIWGKVRSFFGFKPTISFAFTSNFDLIKRALESIPLVEVKEPEKLERLRNIANALVRHVEGSSHSLDHEITRTFLATKKDVLTRKGGPPTPPPRTTTLPANQLSSNREQLPVNPKPKAVPPTLPPRSTLPAPLPLNDCEKEFVRHVRADQKGDRAFLSALMKNLRDNKSQNWLAKYNKDLFKALGQESDAMNMTELCKCLETLFKHGKKSDFKKLELIADTLLKTETLHLDEFLQGYAKEGAVKQSTEYQKVTLLANKPEAALSASEKIALKIPQVREFLLQVKKGDSASRDACQQILSFIETIAKVEGSLSQARNHAKALKSLPDCIRVPQVPALVNLSQVKTIMEAINTYEKASIAIGDIERLKALQERFLAFQTDLGKIKEDVKLLREKVDNSLLPCAAPLFDEIEGRTLYNDFYGRDFGAQLPFQNEAQFAEWLDNQVDLLHEYSKGYDVLKELTVYSRNELNKNMFSKSLPLLKSQQAKDFRVHFEDDKRFAEAGVGMEPRLTSSGYFNRLYQAQMAIVAMPELARYSFDKYIEALSFISQAIKETVEEYKKIWQPFKNYADERELFKFLIKQQQTLLGKLTKMQKEHTEIRKSARTEYLTNLTRQFEEKIPQKEALASNKVLARSVLGNPPRLSKEAIFNSWTPPAAFDKAQKAYLDELKTPVVNTNSKSFFDLIKENAKLKEPVSNPDDDQNWDE